MPSWSPEIANEFISIAAGGGRSLSQMQLQKLVYIAHGWCLAYSEQPLTGDRPEAWAFGPVYRRLSDALARYGADGVTREISVGEMQFDQSIGDPDLPAKADLNSFEMDTIVMVYEDYGALDASRLSSLTQRPGTPWARVFADGAGKFRDIPHSLIRSQFVELARESGQSAPT